MAFAELERRAEAAMSPEIWSYVAGGAGNEHTQDANVTAFERWGLMPRMLRGAAQRDVSVELFGTRFPTPLMLAPVGVSGLSDPDRPDARPTPRRAPPHRHPHEAYTTSHARRERVAAPPGA